MAIDGKTLRRSYDRAGAKSAMHRVSAWASENSVVLGQIKTQDKSNEITAIPALLELLALEGCIVTIDAMGCQKDIAGAIVDQRADYVLALKGNQGQLHENVKLLFDTGGSRRALATCRWRPTGAWTPIMGGLKTPILDHERTRGHRRS